MNAKNDLGQTNTVLAEARREIYDIVHAISVLAMANTDVIHIFTRFAAHVEGFSVRANPVNTDYIAGGDQRDILSLNVYLDGEDALQELLSIESKLTELIIEAREDAEKEVKVEA